MTTTTKNCQSCKTSFVIEPADFRFYEKIQVPPPTWCPQCRFQRRMAWRNERGFYHNACKKCNKKIISVYPSDSGITVYCRPCWWSDDWDGMQYGADFDPNRPFLLQLKDLLYKVPLPDLFGLYTTLENSEYTNMVGYLKNCYFLTMADWDENCAYGSNFFHVKDSFDSLMLDQSELCYQDVNCRECYQTFFSVDCQNCTNVSFSKNCVGCSDCIGCVNLRNKQYHIFNKPYSKEEYTKLATQYQPTTRAKIKEIGDQAHALWQQHPQKYMHERLTQDVTGDYIFNSKNVRDSFMVQEMENSRFCALVLPGKTTDTYDHTHYGISAELLYETLQVGNQAARILASWFVIIGVTDIAYSIFVIGGKNNFGCVGTKKREYCILNKQYSKEAYEKLCTQIIEQMNTMPYVDEQGRVYRYGEFFPPGFSPFGYNISGAQEVMPLTEAEARAQGFKWKAQEKTNYAITVPHDRISETSKDLPDSTTKELFGCAHQGECHDQCSLAFTVIRSELKFYQRFNLPLPDLCPNCRHYERIAKRNPPRLWSRECMCQNGSQGSEIGGQKYINTAPHFHGESPCPNKFETSFAPEKPDIVYCEACYTSELV